MLTDDYIDLLSSGTIKLYLMGTVALMATFMSGYWQSSMTAISAMSRFQEYWDFNDSGVGQSGVSHPLDVSAEVMYPRGGSLLTTNPQLVFSIHPIAACGTFWIGPILADRLGRRGGLFYSSFLYIGGSALIATSHNFAMLLGGRFIIGMGNGMILCAAPPYIVEIAPPLNRGLLTGIFNSFVILGGAVSTIVSIFTNDIQSNMAWRVPIFIQIGFPCYIVAFVYFLPESPRWLYAHGQGEKAKAFLIKYHGDDQLTPLVAKEIRQIEESLALATPTKMWNYSTVASSRSKRYRLMLAMLLPTLQQLPTLYRQVGVTRVRTQLIMTLVCALVGLICALAGTYCTDRFGRRPMLIIGTAACSATLAIAMACSAAASHGSIKVDAATTNRAASKAAIAFLILFYGAYGWGYLGLVAVYPAEVLSTVLMLNMTSVLAQLTAPIGKSPLEKIGWWTYLPWVCWDAAESVIWYFLAVETKGRTLEELDEIFEAPNPVKTSLMLSRTRS
ncbi:hypothetical protein IAT38_002286 [Cryptococcus sp. DSM 104549]